MPSTAAAAWCCWGAWATIATGIRGHRLVAARANQDGSLEARPTEPPRSPPPAPSDSPDLSIVLLTVDHYESVRLTVRHLLGQTIADRLELVLAVPSAATARVLPSELGGFHSVQVVEVGPVSLSGEAKALAVRAARAEFVAFAEEHAFPRPTWAETLVAAHRRGWDAVGPRMLNANGGSAVSWASFLPDYALPSTCLDAREVDALPWHNSSYRRSLLLERGARLGAMLQVEGLLHEALRRRGSRLYLEPRAETLHLNVSRLSGLLRDQWHSGRGFGAERARSNQWSAGRRLFYAAATPLVPPLRIARLVGAWRHGRFPGPSAMLSTIVPTLALGLVTHSLGEACGYLAGAGDSIREKTRIEFHRDLYLNRADLRAWQEHRRAALAAPLPGRSTRAPAGAQPPAAPPDGLEAGRRADSRRAGLSDGGRPAGGRAGPLNA